MTSLIPLNVVHLGDSYLTVSHERETPVRSTELSGHVSGSSASRFTARSRDESGY